MLEIPVPFSDFGSVHERALVYLRARRDRALTADSSLTPSSEVTRDPRLWRFFVACKFDAEAAADMYVAQLEWRRDAGVDAMRADLVAANPDFFTKGSETLQVIHLSDEDRRLLTEVYPRTWSCSAQGAGAGGGFAPLLDRQGNLIYIEAPAYVNFSELATAGIEAYTRAATRLMELQQLVLDELTRRQGRLVLVLRILDLLDLRVVNPFKGSKEKEGERIGKEASKPFAEAYPTTTYKNMLINAPAANMIKPLVAVFVPARSAKKTVILGAKFSEDLQKEADISNLPQKLGGTVDDGLIWTKKR